MNHDWQTSRYLGTATDTCEGWVGELALRLAEVYPTSAKAVAALTQAQAEALVLAFNEGRLRGSTELNSLLYAMFPAPLVRPPAADTVITTRLEEVLQARCAVDVSLRPKSDDGSSSLRADAGSTAVIIGVAALALLLLDLPA